MHFFLHWEQATEHARQRVMADAVRAYCEKFVAGWLILQMLHISSFALAQVVQSLHPFCSVVVFRIAALRCVHRPSMSTVNSAFKEQTKHSVFDYSKKLVVRVTPHVVHFCSWGCLSPSPRAIAAVHAMQDLQCPGRIHNSCISSCLLLATLKPSAG